MSEATSRKVDIGGRALCIAEAGPGDDKGPLVVLEAGSFGHSPDWAEVQSRLAAQGIRSLAYDRAGLGGSDPGDEPRDSLAITNDLRALINELGEGERRLLLVGHSMAAVHIELFALRWPTQVGGLVFLDAIPPEALERPPVQQVVKGYQRLAMAARTASRLGLTAVISPLAGDAIGLSGEARKEKVRAFSSPVHHRWAAAEIALWMTDAAQTTGYGRLDRELPLATVVAGKSDKWWRLMQTEPAHRSRAGYVEAVEGADHANLLGPRHAAAVVRAIQHVRRAILAV